ncbi:MAG TPA: YggT family protein [Crenalkalicoccus sp.]|jgi:YggT family protein|nr:YggT family protein [Crenalkalicoccus sp.]
MVLDAVFFLLGAVLDLVWWAVILAVIVNLLTSFGILDTRNRVVWTVADFLERVTEPLFRPVRNVLPRFGAFDISPLIVLLLIQACKILLYAVRNYLIVGGLYF